MPEYRCPNVTSTSPGWEQESPFTWYPLRNLFREGLETWFGHVWPFGLIFREEGRLAWRSWPRDPTVDRHMWCFMVEVVHSCIPEEI